MDDYREAQVGDLLLMASLLEPNSHLVRMSDGGRDAYERMIVVTVRDGGRTLYLSGYIEGDQPLTPGQWRAAKASLFPNAEQVCFHRRRANGSERMVCLPI